MKLLPLLLLLIIAAAPQNKTPKRHLSDPVFVFENGSADDFRGNESAFSLRRTEGWVRSRRLYDDFVLEFQFRVNDDVTAAAAALRTRIKDLVWADRGYVLWLTGTHAEKLLSRAGGEARALLEQPATALSPGEWHAVKITCEGTRISVFLDKEPERAFDVTPTTGSIVLLANGGPVEFRRIVVHEMEQTVDAEPAVPPGVFHAKEVTALPKVVREVRPKYTRGAMQRRAEGVVELAAVIREDGSVGDVSVIRRLDPDLDEEARLAVKQWHFNPGTRDGKPVPVLVTIEMTFTMK